MTKYEWESELRKNIASLPYDEQKKAIDFYNELFEDRIESGMSESAIVREFGNPFDVANRIIGEFHAERGDQSYNHRPQNDYNAHNNAQSGDAYQQYKGARYKSSGENNEYHASGRNKANAFDEFDSAKSTRSNVYNEFDDSDAYKADKDIDLRKSMGDLGRSIENLVRDAKNAAASAIRNSKAKKAEEKDQPRNVAEKNGNISLWDFCLSLIMLPLGLACYSAIFLYVACIFGCFAGIIATIVFNNTGLGLIGGISIILLLLGIGILLSCYCKKFFHAMCNLARKCFGKCFLSIPQGDSSSKQLEESVDVSREIRKVECNLQNAVLNVIKGEDFKVLYPSGTKNVDVDTKRNTLSIDYKGKKMRKLNAITITVPTEFVELDANINNGMISASGLNLKRIEANMTNSTADIYGLSADKILIENTNGKVVVDSVRAEIAKIKTSNAPIELRTAKIYEADCSTTNAHINVDTLSGENLLLRTSNARIKAIEIEQTQIDIETSNAKVEVLVNGNKNDYDITNIARHVKAKPNGVSRDKRIRVKTTNATSEINFTGAGK